MSETMSAAKTEEADPKVRIRAYMTGRDFADVYWITVTVTAILIGRLRRLSALGKENDLSELRVNLGPDEWGPDDVKNDAGMGVEELVVADDAFWFHARIKDVGTEVQSDYVLIEDFLAAVAAGVTTYSKHWRDDGFGITNDREIKLSDARIEQTESNRIWVKVGKFDVLLNHTSEGIIVDVWPWCDPNEAPVIPVEPLATIGVMDSDADEALTLEGESND